MSNHVTYHSIIRLYLHEFQTLLEQIFHSSENEKYSECWCYLLVIVHILSGKCELFGEPLVKIHGYSEFNVNTQVWTWYSWKNRYQ